MKISYNNINVNRELLIRSVFSEIYFSPYSNFINDLGQNRKTVCINKYITYI